MNHAEVIAAARYVVQKYRRLQDARATESQPNTTEIETAKRAVRHAETMFNCALDDLCAELSDV